MRVQVYLFKEIIAIINKLENNFKRVLKSIIYHNNENNVGRSYKTKITKSNNSLTLFNVNNGTIL